MLGIKQLKHNIVLTVFGSFSIAVNCCWRLFGRDWSKK